LFEENLIVDGTRVNHIIAEKFLEPFCANQKSGDFGNIEIILACCLSYQLFILSFQMGLGVLRLSFNCCLFKVAH